WMWIGAVSAGACLWRRVTGATNPMGSDHARAAVGLSPGHARPSKGPAQHQAGVTDIGIERRPLHLHVKAAGDLPADTQPIAEAQLRVLFLDCTVPRDAGFLLAAKIDRTRPPRQEKLLAEAVTVQGIQTRAERIKIPKTDGGPRTVR